MKRSTVRLIPLEEQQQSKPGSAALSRVFGIEWLCRSLAQAGWACGLHLYNDRQVHRATRRGTKT
jgi:hypothetical protein